MNSIFIVLIISIAVSYGWGMRGALIGGEKGAALPGALLGTFLALFSGNEYIAEKFYFFAAAGAIGTAYGGFEPYAQTMGFILHRGRPDYNKPKGYLGLILKGALWFGISGEVMGMTFSALTGKYYSAAEIIILFLAVPFIQFAGIRIFNKPYDPKNNKFPKIYFSLTSREEWGGNLLMLIVMLALSIINGDTYAVFFSLTGVVSGIVGWCLGIFFYEKQIHPMKNGKFFFGKFNPWVDGWKIMEYTLGAVTGLGFGIYYEITKSTMLYERLKIINIKGFWNPVSFNGAAVAWIIFGLSLFTVLQYKIKSEKYDVGRIFEILERIMFFALPAIPLMLGNETTAKLSAFSSLVFFAAEQVLYDRTVDPVLPVRNKLFVVFSILTAASIISQILFDLPLIVYMLMFTFYYIYADNCHRKTFEKTNITVNSYFFLQSLFLIFITLFAF